MDKSNFEFLKGTNDFLYAIACAAENNYPDDPNTTLVKMRIFGEATAKHLGKLLGLPATESQLDLLRELGKISFVDDCIMGYFIPCVEPATKRSMTITTTLMMPPCPCDSVSAWGSGTTD